MLYTKSFKFLNKKNQINEFRSGKRGGYQSSTTNPTITVIAGKDVHARTVCPVSSGTACAPVTIPVGVHHDILQIL